MGIEYILTADGELYHWGIKGMKWGRRRYQNKDGSLTPAGKKRYAKEEDGDGDESSVEPKQKSLSELSDDEIRSAIARKQLENTYRQYHPEPEKPESFTKKFVEQAVKPAAINAGKDFIEKALKKAAGDLLKDKVDPNSLEALKKTYEKLDYKNKIDKLQNPDKYLSEEDKTKRQDRENKAEDRAARKEGYIDAADKAVKTREAEEAARKAKADSDARAANESKSKEYYDSIYNKAGGEKHYVNPNENRDLALYNSPVSGLPSTSVSSGKKYVNNSPIVRDEYVVIVDEDGTVTIVRRDDL